MLRDLSSCQFWQECLALLEAEYMYRLCFGTRAVRRRVAAFHQIPVARTLFLQNEPQKPAVLVNAARGEGWGA